ncbi:MAG: FG-GAP repeat protein [Planctomycetes bacterium]|nr:FG-GAP repeat protein [Planctomycetota bacterium]
MNTSPLASIVGASTFPLVLTALAAALPSQHARQLLRTFGDGIFGGGGYGRAVVVVGDVDGDGWRDVAVADPFHFPVTGSVGGGKVSLLSGLDGAILHTYVPVLGVDGAGRLLAAPGDVDGDLVPDVLVATQSAVHLVSGADASLLNAFPVAVDALVAAGDWNFDQVPDLAWLVGGVVEVVSGSNGAPIASLGSAVTSVAAIAGPSVWTRYLVVREPGGLTAHQPSGMVWTVGGYERVDDAGWLDGDSIGDVIATASGGATADVLSGFDGSVLLTVPGGESACGGVDLDGDGFADVAVGQPAAAPQGRVRAYSGADGSLLFERAGQEAGEDMGRAVAMHPAFGPTTRPVVLVGASNTYNGSQTAGSLTMLAQAAAGERDGSFRPFGNSCNFTSTHIRPGIGLPHIGTAYSFRFDNLTTPTGFEFLILGTSDTDYAGMSLPLQLQTIASSCTLYVSADHLQFPSMSSFQSINIPLHASLVGARIYVQGLNALGFPVLETSDAAEMTIGN